MTATSSAERWASSWWPSTNIPRLDLRAPLDDRQANPGLIRYILRCYRLSSPLPFAPGGVSPPRCLTAAGQAKLLTRLLAVRCFRAVLPFIVLAQQSGRNCSSFAFD